MKKRFKCGHLGRGQFCHRCAQAVELVDMAKSDTVKAEQAKKYNEEASRLFTVPKKAGAVAMPTDPVPA